MLARTMHGIQYNDVHDEILVSNPFAQALLTFRGGANGEEAPIRVIHGAQTQLGYPDKPYLDAVHDEYFIAQGNAVLVFPRTANGNVAPIRVLQGPDTQLSGTPNSAPSAIWNASGPHMAIDPVNNRLIVKQGQKILIFDRTAQGNTKPRAVIGGPNARVGGGFIFVTPKGDIVTIGTGRVLEGVDNGGKDDEAGPNAGGFVRVWDKDANGDVPGRRWRLGLPQGPFYDPNYYGHVMGAGIDPKNRSIMVSSKGLNAVLTYVFPEIF